MARINASPASERDYHDFYTDETMLAVSRIYADDIRIFGARAPLGFVFNGKKYLNSVSQLLRAQDTRTDKEYVSTRDTTITTRPRQRPRVFWKGFRVYPL